MPTQDKISTKKLVFMSLLVALGLCFHGIEELTAFVTVIPGLKLGLANIITLVSLNILSIKETGAITITRLLLLGIISGKLLTPSFLMSFAGGILSFVSMALISKTKNTSVFGISLIGAATHNIGQILMVCILISGISGLHYLPFLLLWSIPMGIITALASYYLIKAIKKSKMW